VDPTVLAAGGVLWRPAGGPDGIEVAVVHRPRYDDWSLPKGKLTGGELPLVGALREVHEETGWAAVAGRTLGTSRYEVLLDGVLVPKTVRWWALRATDGGFTPSDEVDELRWLAPASAEALLTAHRDVAPLRLLVSAGLGTTTVVLVRHGRAGERATWPGEDDLRPLDERGRRQAERLAGLLPAYAPVRVVSPPVVRCVQTVAPLADALHLPVRLEAVYGEEGYAEDPEAAVQALLALGAAEGTSVVASQGGAMPALVEAVAERAGLVLAPTRVRKGAVWALTFRDGILVDEDQYGPLA
jgi:phosphohistidine phosphatase SixA/8-oxo-dGTP pyrophosphatase MutT (NUDIX family)